MRYLVRGFTLIELLVTMVVAAIILSIAVPSFQTQIRDNRSIALGEDFASAINFARSEAVKRSARVSLCASRSSTDCDGAWTDGFIVFVDDVTRDTEVPPAVGAVLKVWGKQDPNAIIDVKSGTDEVNFIRYTGLGTLARVRDTPIVITAAMQKCTVARKLTISLSGLVSVGRASCNNS